jgi:uncharacterized membrane protein
MRDIGNPTGFLSIAVPAFALAGGSWVILGVCIFMFVGVVIGYYTEKGSGIHARPYGKVYGGAPGAFGPGEVSGRDSRERVDWSRGTR